MDKKFCILCENQMEVKKSIICKCHKCGVIDELVNVPPETDEDVIKRAIDILELEDWWDASRLLKNYLKKGEPNAVSR